MHIEFAHANGFGFRTYRYFLSLLAPYPVVGVDKYGHGNYAHNRNWTPLVGELIAHLESKHRKPAVAVGHSLGGALIFFAARRRPELFEKIILLDPPLFSPTRRFLLWVARRLGVSGLVIPPARKTKKRRRDFNSYEAAMEYFGSKKLFKNFHPQGLADYVTQGLRQKGKAGEEQNGLTLDFSAEVEYRIFCQTPFLLGKKSFEMPAYFVYSNQYEVLQNVDINRLKSAFSEMKFLPFEGGHMFPLEKPQETASLIKKIIETV